MQTIEIKTDKAKQILDITKKVDIYLSEQSREQGLIYLFVKHTTCSLSTADLDPGTDQDYLDAFEQIIPQLDYNHPHDPSHVDDHINSTIIGPGVMLPFDNKQLQLGTWQRVVLVELNGPRSREVVLKVI